MTVVRILRGGRGSGGTLQTPPPVLAVVVAPQSGTELLCGTFSFTATVTKTFDIAVLWRANHIPGGSAQAGTKSADGVYTAPADLPQGGTVQVTATSHADSSKSDTAAVALHSDIVVAIAPGTANVELGSTQSFHANITSRGNPDPTNPWNLSGAAGGPGACGRIGAWGNYSAPQTLTTAAPVADTATSTAKRSALRRTAQSVVENGLSEAVHWTVDGLAGSNSTIGQICALGSSPCQSSFTAVQVAYIASGAILPPNPDSVFVSSANSPLLTASSHFTVLNHRLVSVQPNNATLALLGVQGFAASVLGTSNQEVVWRVHGAGSAAGECGVITPPGAYTAPLVSPTPNALQIVAFSQDDTTRTGSANVSLCSGPNILPLHQAKVYAGASGGFTIHAGSGFVSSSPGPGLALLIGGMPRVSTCDTANSCSAPVSSTDVTQAESVTVQAQNPDATESHVVSLVVDALGTTENATSLNSANPAEIGADITVVEPDTIGLDTSDSNLDLEVTASNPRSLAGNPIPLVRPENGTTAADIYLFSQAGFDTSMSCSISGSGDIAAMAKQPAGLGIIHLTLQVPRTAAPGARAAAIQNANLDRTPASGVLEI